MSHAYSSDPDEFDDMVSYPDDDETPATGGIEYQTGGPERPRNVTHADARNRGMRSLWQNALSVVVVGALGAVAVPLAGATVENLADVGWWITAGLMLTQGATAALAAYIQRRIEERKNRTDLL